MAIIPPCPKCNGTCICGCDPHRYYPEYRVTVIHYDDWSDVNAKFLWGNKNAYTKIPYIAKQPQLTSILIRWLAKALISGQK